MQGRKLRNGYGMTPPRGTACFPPASVLFGTTGSSSTLPPLHRLTCAYAGYVITHKANYNQLNFINRALHASKPHLRAPTTQGVITLIAAQKAAAIVAKSEADAAAVAELKSKLTTLLRALFDKLDMDGDGSVSHEEWTHTLDTNSEWT